MQGRSGARIFIRITRQFGWTKSVLTHQSDNQNYEKALLNQIIRLVSFSLYLHSSKLSESQMEKEPPSRIIIDRRANR